jgi:hypothetical protein
MSVHVRIWPERSSLKTKASLSLQYQIGAFVRCLCLSSSNYLKAMTNESALIRNFRIIESIDKNDRRWYYVQKKFLFFWLIILNPEGFSSLQEAKEEIHNHLFGHELEYVIAR